MVEDWGREIGMEDVISLEFYLWNTQILFSLYS